MDTLLSDIETRPTGSATAASVTPPPALTKPQITVHLPAIAANTRAIAERVTGGLIAVVKADGYGHGAVEVARTALANGATSLGVTSIDEALELRAAGLTAPIISWLNPVDADWTSAIIYGIALCVPSVEHLEALAAAVRCQVMRGSVLVPRIHLQLDTGMSRDGCEPRRWPELCQHARTAEEHGLLSVVGVMGHLGCAASPADPENATARAAFECGVTVAREVGLNPRVRHLAATAAALTDPATHFDLCRVGAGLVGIDPSQTTTLRSAMTLAAPLVSVRSVPAGSLVGYGRAYATRREMRLGLLPLGYADGIARIASGRAQVSVRGVRCPVLGTISMDQTVIGLDEVPDVRSGETATVFGPGEHGEPTAAEWACWAGTIEHEIVTGIGRRVRRVHESGEGAGVESSW